MGAGQSSFRTLQVDASRYRCILVAFAVGHCIGMARWPSYHAQLIVHCNTPPTDYTPVCTTELGAVGKLKEEFDKRGVKVLALSCNDVDSHKGCVDFV